MTDLATDEFLNELKSLYPIRQAPTPDAVLAQPWYLVAAVAFSASHRAEAVPIVFESALAELKLVQSHANAEKVREERLRLANKIREALLQSGLLSGVPRVIDSLIALHTVMPEELQSKVIIRDTKKNMEAYEKSGEQLFRSMYRDTADSVQTLLDSAYPDLGWWSNTIGYGVTYGGTSVLSQVETSYVIVAALIAVDAPRQIVWHLANAQNGGATLEEAKAVREIAMKVSQKAGVKWKSGVPEVI
ncbi:hypothetical protein AcW2_004097 [Taiwanofungus camphoratus]|nr:hypothetical protein AcW2_004097 [Antrodia cinnamomea]